MPAGRPEAILRSGAIRPALLAGGGGRRARLGRAGAGRRTDQRQREALAARGLIVSGSFAVLPQELELRKRLEALDGAIKRTTAARAQVDAQLQRNEVIRAALRQAESLAKPDGGAAAKSPGGEGKDRPPERLNSHLPDVTAAGEETPLQVALVDWINARGTLQLSMLEIERTIAALQREYQHLAADSAVSAAVADGGGVRLGPAKDYRRQPRLASARDVFSTRQPIYRQCGRWRVGAVLNEQTLATFSFVEQSRPTFLSARLLAESLGLEPDPRAGRTAADRRAGVRRPAGDAGLAAAGQPGVSRRPGAAAAPEAEDLGSQLASGSLSGCRVRLEANQIGYRPESHRELNA